MITRLLAPYPNPFNPSTKISFECREPGLVNLGIFDLAGRRVIDLFDGWLEMGYHEENWNGLNMAGQSVAAGQYLVRLTTESNVVVQKITLAK